MVTVLLLVINVIISLQRQLCLPCSFFCLHCFPSFGFCTLTPPCCCLGLLRSCSFRISSGFSPAIFIRSLGSDLSFYSGYDSHSGSSPSKLLCVRLYSVDACPLGFSQ
jgi:hypothetical protein